MSASGPVGGEGMAGSASGASAGGASPGEGMAGSASGASASAPVLEVRDLVTRFHTRSGAVHAVEVRHGDHQQRAHALAAADRGVAHRLDQASAAVRRHGKIGVERPVDIVLHPRQRGFEQIVALRNGHRRHDAASKGAVPAGRPCPSVTIFSIRACAASSRAWQWVRSASPRS